MREDCQLENSLSDYWKSSSNGRQCFGLTLLNESVDELVYFGIKNCLGRVVKSL